MCLCIGLNQAYYTLPQAIKYGGGGGGRFPHRMITFSRYNFFCIPLTRVIKLQLLIFYMHTKVFIYVNRAFSSFMKQVLKTAMEPRAHQYTYIDAMCVDNPSFLTVSILSAQGAPVQIDPMCVDSPKIYSMHYLNLIRADFLFSIDHSSLFK